MTVIFVVGSRVALEFILDNEVMAFRAAVKTELLTEGMKFAIYTTRGAYGNPSKDRSQILALGRLVSGVTDHPHSIGHELFPRSCQLRIEARLPWRNGLLFEPLIDELAFVGGRRRYSSVFHRTIVKVPVKDFDRISSDVITKIEDLNRLSRKARKGDELE